MFSMPKFVHPWSNYRLWWSKTNTHPPKWEHRAVKNILHIIFFHFTFKISVLKMSLNDIFRFVALRKHIICLRVWKLLHTTIHSKNETKCEGWHFGLRTQPLKMLIQIWYVVHVSLMCLLLSILWSMRIQIRDVSILPSDYNLPRL